MRGKGEDKGREKKSKKERKKERREKRKKGERKRTTRPLPIEISGYATVYKGDNLLFTR